MSYWTIVSRKRGEAEWHPYETHGIWHVSRAVACTEIEAIRIHRRKLATLGTRLEDIEFAVAQVRVEAE
jgi:hypothetical protein